MIKFCKAFICLQLGFVIVRQKEIGVKGAGKMLLKLTIGVNFINIFLCAFLVQIFGAKPNVTRENDVRTKNLYEKCC